MKHNTVVRSFGFGYVTAFASETGGAYSLVTMPVGPGGGPPIHTHAFENEGFLVIMGRFEVWVGDNKPVTLGRGEHAFGPRDVPHHFRNVGHEWGEIQLILSPGGLEQYFIELEKARADTGIEDLPSLLEAIDERYGIQGIVRHAKAQEA